MKLSVTVSRWRGAYPRECRLAIRAATFWPEADALFLEVVERVGEATHNARERGSFKGAIRIPLRSLKLFFNDLVFLRVSRKFLKFLASIPTAPTKPQPCKNKSIRVRWLSVYLWCTRGVPAFQQYRGVGREPTALPAFG
jgi:hypothetical protein